MAYLIHAAAMESKDSSLQWILDSQDWRVITRGSPVQWHDTLVGSWDQRVTLARWLQTRRNPVIILNAERRPVDFVVRGIDCVQQDDFLHLHNLKPYRDHQVMPYNWKGYTWFRVRELYELSKTADSHLLDRNVCRTRDSDPFVRTGMERNRDYTGPFPWMPWLPSGAGQIYFTLRKCIERMPHEMSVLCTVASFPYHRVPRAYLEWLVFDGVLPNGRMRTSLQEGVNELRSSLRYYLSMTAEHEVRGGQVREKGEVKYRGSFRDSTGTPEIRALRKQAELMDFQPRDLEGRDFCTFGYWNVDTFIACGTSSKVRFEAHGPPTWLEIGEGRIDPDSLPAHVKTGLSEFERLERWLPAEKENYDWKPVLPPRTYNRAILKLFDLHARMDRWCQRQDYLSQQDKLEMRDADREDLEWEWKEHGLELDRMRTEYLDILRLYAHLLPSEWGMRERFGHAAKLLAGRSGSRDHEEVVEQEYILTETSKVSAWRELYSQQLREKEQNLREAKAKRKAVDWDEVQSLRAGSGMSRALRDSLRFARTQAPQAGSARQRLDFLLGETGVAACSH